MLNPTVEKLRTLRLTGMADALVEQRGQPSLDLDFETRLALLVEQEWIRRQNNRVKQRLQKAQLKQNACVENLDFNPARGLNKAQVLELAQGQWITQHLNVLITGPTGCGKTYLACALGHKACLLEKTSGYWRLPRLLQRLKVARADGSYEALLQQLAKVEVLILDDWGIAPLEPEALRDLLELLDDRYGIRSTIVTSQLPVQEWYGYLAQATLADAILDRLVHSAIRFALGGKDSDSLRKTRGIFQ